MGAFVLFQIRVCVWRHLVDIECLSKQNLQFRNGTTDRVLMTMIIPMMANSGDTRDDGVQT